MGAVIFELDTFGDKPQGLTLGIQSRSAEGGKEKQGLVALSVNTEDTKESNIQKTSPDVCLALSAQHEVPSGYTKC